MSVWIGKEFIMFFRIFQAHPAAVGESYLGHMGVAFRIAGRLFRAAAAALLHGIVPALCETTASTAVLGMADEMRQRRAMMARSKALAAGADAIPPQAQSFPAAAP